MDARGRNARLAIVAVLLVAVLLAGQAASDGLTVGSRTATGQLLGRTSFGFLSGIRVFVALALWARTIPLNENYYDASTLKDKLFLLPNIRIVTALDPQFETPYWVGPWILYERGLKREAEQLAREGVANNPRSGYLAASYAQLLVAEGRFAEAAVQADHAMAGTFPSDADKAPLLVPLEIAYNKTGQTAKAEAVRAEEARIAAVPAAPGSVPTTAPAQ